MIEYILPENVELNMLTQSHFVKILCITPNISSQENKMIKYGPCVMNECLMLEFSLLKGKFSIKALSILHKVPVLL